MTQEQMMPGKYMQKSSKKDSTLHSCQTVKRSQPARDELVKILYFQPIYIILSGHAMAVFISVFFLWGTVPLPWLLSWAILLSGQTLIWAYMVQQFRKTPHQIENTNKAINVFPIAATVTGILWGMTIYFPNIFNDITALIFLSIMVLGISAAGLAVFAPYLRSFSLFSSLILIPFVIRFFIEGDKLYLTLASMYLLYFCVLLISGINMRRAVGQAIELRLENIGLIDDLKTQYNHAEKSREDAEQANVSKSKFLAAASHDLRQPLHALGLFVDALESRIHFKEVKDIVSNIRISTDALSDLLNALLDISKLDAGVLQPKPTDFQLRPVLQRIQTDFSDVAKDKSLSLKIVDCGLVVHTDPTMLERILRNLVSNAIRYTHHGKVLLGCRRQDDNINIQIHDTGIGIEKENLENIFEEFYQVANPERDRNKGLGLGLAIVKRLSDLINCPINVSSEVGKGTTFQIRVPYVEKQISTIIKAESYNGDLAGTRVIIIDDEVMIRKGMTTVLQEWGCSVMQAESIAEAQKLVGDDCAIDMILSDYRLRENTTGIDAILALHNQCKRNIPAIILTGDTDPERLKEAKASGFKLLHKPVSSAKLRSLMGYLLENSD